MTEEPDEPEFTVKEEKLEKEIKVEINKLEYYLQDVDELIVNQDLKEIKVTYKRTDEILDRWEHKRTQELKCSEQKSLKGM